MSRFYWQLQTNRQQQGKKDANNGDDWSCVGLTNDSFKEELQQQQQSYWWHQQNVSLYLLSKRNLFCISFLHVLSYKKSPVLIIIVGEIRSLRISVITALNEFIIIS